MTRRFIFAALPALLLLAGCPEPEAPSQPGAPSGAPAANIPAGTPPDGVPAAPNAAGGAPPVPEGTAPGAQDNQGTPGEAAPDGSDPVPEGEAPPLGEGVVPPTVEEGDKPGTLAPGEDNIPCGDGECDDAEKQNPNLCPRDCADTPPPGGDWCGDGVCDALEESNGSCAKDCNK